ncbi:hypothetical protein V6767_20345 [Martelella sp. FLE1502]
MGYYDFHSSSVVNATKTKKRCDHCGGEIQAGAKALKFAGKFDGDFYSYYCHEECRSLWDALFSDLQFDAVDGAPIDILEMFDGATDKETVDHLRALEGQYPAARRILDRALIAMEGDE